MTNTGDLQRRAVACKRWRWVKGMSCGLGTVYAVRNGMIWCIDSEGNRRSDRTNVGWRPDLNDPATLGCLLALVREVLPEAYVEPLPCGTGYRVWAWIDGTHWQVCAVGATEIEALVVALETAP